MERTDPEEVNDKINKMLFIYSSGRWQTSLSWRWSRWQSEQHFTDAVNGAVYVLDLWVLLLLGGVTAEPPNGCSPSSVLTLTPKGCQGNHRATTSQRGKKRRIKLIAMLCLLTKVFISFKLHHCLTYWLKKQTQYLASGVKSGNKR